MIQRSLGCYNQLLEAQEQFLNSVYVRLRTMIRLIGLNRTLGARYLFDGHE
ncbi:hypothetical protein M8C21_011984 [Ambrosia artemisiifolia]|uniref:Uncharacterized protein n=1 Tax=Ambrosia artemisiifolia TaxID=4212 RepID=A0AAD5CBZ4_AMBAR|nr:hypothetical protein M8C21_011984 [Ambrosia artemisiifolia]